jgi:hypothetical protein
VARGSESCVARPLACRQVRESFSALNLADDAVTGTEAVRFHPELLQHADVEIAQRLIAARAVAHVTLVLCSL